MRAGFSLLILSIILNVSATAQRTVAVTIDDLPKAVVGGDNAAGDINDVRATTWEIVGALDRAHVPAIGFVNESKVIVTNEIEQRLEILRAWPASGLTLGNHTFSHPNLNDTPIPKFEDEIIKGELFTRALLTQFGKELHYFRFPYNSAGNTQEKRDAIRQFLADRHYVIAPTTISNEDWIWNEAYVKAKRARNFQLMEKISTAYLDYIDPKFEYFEKLSQAMFGRQIPQVLLLHANDLNAHTLRFLLERIRKRGYAFVSLDQAVKDAAYQQTDEYIGPYGMNWFSRWAIGKGQQPDKDEPNLPAWLNESTNSQ